MADILIRGMEMPKDCLSCPLMVDRYETDACALQSQDANEASENWDDLKRGCPLVPLPEGHGKLIDADALITRINGFEQRNSEDDTEFLTIKDIYDAFVETLTDDCPTVIPAEGGTKNA